MCVQQLKLLNNNNISINKFSVFNLKDSVNLYKSIRKNLLYVRQINDLSDQYAIGGKFWWTPL